MSSHAPFFFETHSAESPDASSHQVSSPRHFPADTQAELQDSLVLEIHKLRGNLDDALTRTDAQQLEIKDLNEQISTLLSGIFTGQKSAEADLCRVPISESPARW